MKAENRESFAQRDSVERKEYEKAPSAVTRENREKDRTPQDLLRKILQRNNMMQALDRVEKNKWLRRRLRQYIWKQWKKPKTRKTNLRRLGIPEDKAAAWSNTRRGYWRISASPILTCSITNEKLARAGHYDISNAYEQKRRFYLRFCG